MTNILFHAHSGIRYLVLLAGVVALVYMLWNMTRSRPWNETGQTLLGVFVGVMDLQVLLGLILLLLRPFFPALIGHIVLMLLAVSVGHVASAMNRKRPPEKQTYVLPLLGVAVPLLLIVAGIMAIQRPVL